MSVTKADMSERAMQLLKVLTERYIRDGQPVGSRTLSRESGLQFSPATIRNMMADLEDLGLIRSPHTSAGRVPTVQGYRMFVDSLLTVKPLDEGLVSRMRSELKTDQDPKGLVATASSLLSGITQLAGIVTLPKREHVALKRVEFLPLSEHRVLAVLVISDRDVQNRILKVDRPYTPSELQQASNYLNEQFAGRDLQEVRRILIRDMKNAREDMNRMMRMAMEMADSALNAAEEGDDFVMAGQTNLMEFEELCDLGTLRQLFEAFNRKRDILHLFDQCVIGEGVQIFIGEESGYQMLDECSVVTAPYSVDGRVVGVLGVIGPTRMAYERVIPIVDATARIMGAALNPKE